MEPYGAIGVFAAKRPLGFSRSVRFVLSDEERANVTAYCRHYSMVDEFNRPSTGEAIRLLATIALTEGEDTSARALVAIRCQVMMSIASFGHRLARDFSTADSGLQTPRKDDGGNSAKMVYDTVMLRLIERMSPMFRTDDGKARDVLLARYLISAGLRSPDLHQITSTYAVASASLRAKISGIEAQVSEYVRNEIGEWANGGGA